MMAGEDRPAESDRACNAHPELEERWHGRPPQRTNLRHAERGRIEMTSQMTAGLFLLAGLLFIVAGLLPVFRGESVRIVFFVLGVAFTVLGIAFQSASSRGQDKT